MKSRETLIAMLLMASLAAPAYAQSQTPWTGTWSVAPQVGGANTAFNERTVRQALHTSIGGSAARIKISNLFGTDNLQISDVHLAQTNGVGPSIIAGTDHKVTFGGQSSTTIAPGAEVESDAVAMTIAPLSDYAVSMFFPSAPSVIPTFHQDGRENTFFADGDVSGNTNITQVDGSQSIWFLTNLDVQNPAATGAIVALGASITDGDKSNFETNTRWTNDLATRLSNAGLTVGVLNEGISGNHLLIDSVAGLSATNRFANDVLAQPNVRYVIFSDDIINDLGISNPPPSADTFIAAVRQLIAEAHQHGIKFVCSTLTPFAGASGWTPAQETVREQVNSFIHTSNECDGVIDQDAAIRDPSNPTFMLAALNQNPDGTPGDGLHPNDAGHTAIANAINLGLFTADGAPPSTNPTRTDTLKLGQSLEPGQALVSDDGRFQLLLQTDGHLVIDEGTTALWSVGGGGAPAQVTFQQDGNLVETGTSGNVLYQSNSAGLGGQTLIIQNDGNLVIYNGSGNPVFASNTCCH
ncbi:MAG: hypothetical protein QOI59_798 [Gammaproteobacteria bacterium]|jgi:lysophospholipase L1-like esterase|nr:hypothetical protein [Gammaproteobacteria bacterium]